MADVSLKEELLFRSACKEDINRIDGIEKRVFPYPWSKAQLYYELINKASVPIVVEFSGKLIGYSFSFYVVDEGHIANISIDTPYRGRGFGGSLLDRTIYELSDRGAEKIFLEVRENNYTAINMYVSRDFVEYGIRRRYYANGENAILMKKEI